MRKLRAPNTRMFNALAVLIGLALLFFPTRQLIAQQVAIGELRERRDALQETNAYLAFDVERLQDPEQIEVVARERLGLVRPGEQAYFIVTDDDTVLPRTPLAVPIDDDAWWQRSWRWFTGLLRGSR